MTSCDDGDVVAAGASQLESERAADVPTPSTAIRSGEGMAMPSVMGLLQL